MTTTAVLLAAGLLLAPPRANPNVVPIHGVFDQEPALAQTITLTATNKPLGEIVSDLKEKLKVDLKVQGDLYHRPTTIQVRKPRPAKLLLRYLAELSDGHRIRRLVQRDQSFEIEYVMLDDADTARVAANYNLYSQTWIDQHAVVASLTQKQRDDLLAKKKLTFEELSLPQKRLCLIVMAHEFWQNPARHPQKMMAGIGVELWYDPKLGRVGFAAPEVKDGRERIWPFSSLPLPTGGR
jgi:hypothetical protein